MSRLAMFRSADTTEEAARVQREIYHQMPPSRRLQLIFEMNEDLRELLAAGVRDRHPDYTEAQVKLEFTARRGQRKTSTSLSIRHRINWIPFSKPAPKPSMIAFSR